MSKSKITTEQRERRKESTKFLEADEITDAVGAKEIIKDLVTAVLKNGWER